MRSGDFDDWLSTVLQEDAGIDPRSGFEARLLARLSAEDPSASRRKTLRAALIAGAVAASLLVWVRPAQRPCGVSRASSIGSFAGNSVQVEKSLERKDQLTIEWPHVARERGFRRTKFRTNTSSKPLSVMPIAIDPLMVEPIEIASLNPERGRTKGESQ